MKRFVFAVAAVALVASVGSAQETPATSPPVATPVVIGSAGPVVEATSVATAPARRGLFGRLRGRGTATTTMPATGTTVLTPGTVVTPSTTVAPAPTTAPVPMPMPMPGTKTPSTMTVPAAPNGIVLASGTVMSTEMSGTVMPAMATTTTTTARRGLFGRLRSR